MRQDEPLAALIENLPCGILCCRNEPDFPLISVNPGLLELFGYTREELITLHDDRFIELIHPDDRAAAQKALDLPEGAVTELEYRGIHKNGGVIRILDQTRAVVDPDGTRTAYCVIMDITRRKQAQEALRLAAERMQVIMDQTNDIIFEWDLRSDTIHYSNNWKKRFGYPPISNETGARLAASLNIFPEDRTAYLDLIRRIREGTPYSEAEYRILSLADQFVWYRARATVQFDDDGVPVKAVGVLADIDAEKRREEKLLDQARRDALTDLYNKKAARIQAEELIAKWEPGTVQALMIIDLDDFKRINDRYGHMCGDAVLTELAGCLKKLFRATDSLGRIGGDEFLAYLPSLPSREAAVSKAKAILSALAGLSLHGGGKTGVSCSIGISFFPEDGAEYAQLYRCADMALYQAKSRGKSGYAIYDSAACAHFSGIDFLSATLTGDAEEESITDLQLSQYAFQLLYSSVSTEAAIREILELAGRTYDVSRVYICEASADGRRCRKTFEWCNGGVTPQREDRPEMSLRGEFGNYLDFFNGDDVFYCSDISRLPVCLHDTMAEQDIALLLQCAIREDGVFLGFVGFDECRAGQSWCKEQIRSLTMVANVLSTFLLKLRLKERVAELEQRMR
ncbi:MAG: sensor domain-containing diguanylate cyclase [Clostridia bacterium]|nr:sensor domain-containing diguanylate cyclase [Clostridia bacterium]